MRLFEGHFQGRLLFFNFDDRVIPRFLPRLELGQRPPDAARSCNEVPITFSLTGSLIVEYVPRAASVRISCASSNLLHILSSAFCSAFLIGRPGTALPGSWTMFGVGPLKTWPPLCIEIQCCC